MGILVLDPGIDQRVRRQVVFEDAVIGLGFLVVIVGKVVAAFEGGDSAGAQGAFRVERAEDVRLAAIAVPRSGADRGIALQFAGRALEHEVDRRGRVAHALQQAAGAAHDFDTVERCGVDWGQEADAGVLRAWSRPRRSTSCERGYLVLGGQIIDATVVPAPKQRNILDRNRSLATASTDGAERTLTGVAGR